LNKEGDEAAMNILKKTTDEVNNIINKELLDIKNNINKNYDYLDKN
jgi:hypothetical protein